MPRATWFCVDIECSGGVPALFDMLSLAAVPVIEHPDGCSLGETFLVEVRPTAPRVDPGAMAVNGLDLDRLRREGLPLVEALERLDAFVAAWTSPGSVPVFVGHNAVFDWSFVAYAYAVTGRRNPFGYKALDTKALAMGVLGLHWFDTNKEILMERLGLGVQDDALVHRAEYDASVQARILVGLLQQRAAGGA